MLIDSENLIARIDKCYHESAKTGLGLEPVMAIRDIKALISVMPTVDAAPVKHGRWEDYGHCSCCGWGWSDLVYDRTEQMSRMNYCPCCGACMDSEGQHD